MVYKMLMRWAFHPGLYSKAAACIGLQAQKGSPQNLWMLSPSTHRTSFPQKFSTHHCHTAVCASWPNAFLVCPMSKAHGMIQPPSRHARQQEATSPGTDLPVSAPAAYSGARRCCHSQPSVIPQSTASEGTMRIGNNSKQTGTAAPASAASRYPN